MPSSTPDRALPIVRPVTEADADDLAALYAFESVIEQTSQLPYGTAAFWSGFYGSKGPDGLELVAECDGRAVGHLGILLSSNPRRKHVGSFGIAVHPDHQGRGVGRALMEALVRLADEWLALLRIELDVSSDNERAIALYRRFGFTVEGEARYDLYRRGRYGHTTRMARLHPHHAVALGWTTPPEGDER